MNSSFFQDNQTTMNNHLVSRNSFIFLPLIIRRDKIFFNTSTNDRNRCFKRRKFFTLFHHLTFYHSVLTHLPIIFRSKVLLRIIVRLFPSPLFLSSVSFTLLLIPQVNLIQIHILYFFFYLNQSLSFHRHYKNNLILHPCLSTK